MGPRAFDLWQETWPGVPAPRHMQTTYLLQRARFFTCGEGFNFCGSTCSMVPGDTGTGPLEPTDGSHADIYRE